MILNVVDSGTFLDTQAFFLETLTYPDTDPRCVAGGRWV